MIKRTSNKGGWGNYLPEIGRGFSLLLASVVLLAPTTAAALSADQKQVYDSGINYFDVNPGTTTQVACGTGATGGTVTTQGPTGSTAWNSGLQPPYYLEEFAINVLEDLAQAANVPQTDTLTQEHVVALVSWFSLEGGNTANTDTFNPLNSNELVPGSTTQSTGDQAYPSFDSGVQATVLTMLGSNQNRVAITLEDPSTTAEQFMQAETYYQNYPGNHHWAEADPEPLPTWTDPSTGTVWTQQMYLDSLMASLQSTRSNYDLVATTELGPGLSGNNPHVPTSELKYAGGSSNPTSGAGGTGCQTATGTSVDCQNNGTPVTGNAAIACDVLQYSTISYNQAWHSSGSVFHSNCPTIGPQCATDCSGLVNIALYDVFNNDVNDTTYTEITDSANFKEISFSELHPGDFIQPNPDHVEVVESVQGSTINTFGAHSENETPEVGTATYTDTAGYVYLRYKGIGTTYQ